MIPIPVRWEKEKGKGEYRSGFLYRRLRLDRRVIEGLVGEGRVQVEVEGVAMIMSSEFEILFSCLALSTEYCLTD